MQTAGKINIEIYRCIAENITTDEVVITEERIRHIQERHPGSFEKIEPCLQTALEHPDYILEDRHPNSGLVLKTVEENDVRFQMVLRIHTSADEPAYKNSIISAWEISESRWKNYVNNKKVLYKRE